MFQVSLTSLENPTLTIVLNDGVSVLGRGPLLEITDKRCSRHQASISIDTHRGECEVTALGVNPVVVKRAPQDQVGVAGVTHNKRAKPVVVKTNCSHRLQDGDIIHLLPDLFPFRVSIQSEAVVSDAQPSAGAPTPAVGPSPPAGTASDQSNRVGSALDTGELDAPQASSTAHSLAFPSISTGAFHFDLEKAATVLCREVTAFLQRCPDPRLRLILCDITDSQMLALVHDKMQTSGPDGRPDPRFTTMVANITQLQSMGTPCAYIVNTANWRLKGGGSGINKAIHQAAGPGLQQDTKAKYGTAVVGRALPIELQSTSPLRKDQRVTHVIHILGPNMNPQRPNYLGGDYGKACEQLEQCYRSIFDEFQALAQLDSGTSTQKNGDTSRGGHSGSPQLDMPRSAVAGDFARSSTFVRRGHWQNALVDIVQNPSGHSSVLAQLTNCIIIKDKYPKARYHHLLLPTDVTLTSISVLERKHLPVLKAFHDHAVGHIKSLRARHTDTGSVLFRIGCHAIPSMAHFHIHIISQDFDSPCLKNKKHWNSFTSPFFIDLRYLLLYFEDHERMEISQGRYDQYLRQPLECHRCGKVAGNIPILLRHTQACTQKQSKAITY